MRLVWKSPSSLFFVSLKKSSERDYIWGCFLIDGIKNSLVSKFPSRRYCQGDMNLWGEGLFLKSMTFSCPVKPHTLDSPLSLTKDI